MTDEGPEIQRLLLSWVPRPPSGNHTFKTHFSVNPGLAPPGCVQLFKQELYLFPVGTKHWAAQHW